MAEDTNQKYVTFRVGNEVYGIDIMLVHSIVDIRLSIMRMFARSPMLRSTSKDSTIYGVKSFRLLIFTDAFKFRFPMLLIKMRLTELSSLM